MYLAKNINYFVRTMVRFYLAVIGLLLTLFSCHVSRLGTAKKTLTLSASSLQYPGSGFRYVSVNGEDWWVNRLVVGDSMLVVGNRSEERDSGYWSGSCAWLTVKRGGDRLTVSVDAEKKMNFDAGYFLIDIQDKDTTVTLKGMLGEVLSGGGEDITPSVRNVVFDCNGGSASIDLKCGVVDAVIVDGKKTTRWSRRGLDLENNTYDWLTVSGGQGKTLKLEAAKNVTGKTRTFSLLLACFDSYAHIYGFQQAVVDIPSTDSIGFVPSNVSFPLEGGTVEVAARTDGWVLDEKSDGLDWLMIEQDGPRLRLTATPNFDYDIRHFTLRYKKGNYCEFLEGSQQTR